MTSYRHIQVVLLVFLIVPALRGNEPADSLRAGAAAVPVTPERFPVIVNGMFTERQATGAHDPLMCRCLVLDDGGYSLAIAVVDSCMMPRELLDKAKEMASAATGIPVARMLVCATHTHSAPAAMGCLGSDADPLYPAFLQAQIARCITLAHQKLEPARIGWTSTGAPEFTHNRRWIYRSDRMLSDPFGGRTVRANMHPGYLNPEAIGPSGPSDPELSLVGVQSRAGKPLAVLTNYSMHYFGSPMVSSDYFGAFCNRLAQQIQPGSPPMVMMTQGTSGDLMWMDYGRAKVELAMEKYADRLASLALQAYRRLEYHNGVNLAMIETKLSIERRVPDQARLAWAQKVVAGLQGRKPMTQAEIYAREAVLLHETPLRELRLQTLRIGELGIFAIPNEVFAITGLRLKAESPLQRTFVIELANGAEGYIPPPAQHALGGYTTWPARTAGLEVQAEPRIVETLLLDLTSLAGRKPVLTPAGAYADAVKQARPHAYWHFAEFCGPKASDVMGQCHGVYEPGVAFFLDGPPGPSFTSAGAINRCVHFAGGRMATRCPNLGQRYSFEAWLWNGLPKDARPVSGYFFSRGPAGDKDAAGDHLGIGGTLGHGGKLIVFNGNQRNQLLGGKRELPTRTWHHVVLVRDGAQVRIYLDGELDAEGTAEVTLPPNCNELFLGGRSDGFAGLEGKLDECAVYDRALTPKEIAAHYSLGVAQ